MLQQTNKAVLESDAPHKENVVSNLSVSLYANTTVLFAPFEYTHKPVLCITLQKYMKILYNSTMIQHDFNNAHMIVLIIDEEATVYNFLLMHCNKVRTQNILL